MAKKSKNKGGKKGESKKAEPKKAEPNPIVTSAREAYVVGNYAAVRVLHERVGELKGDDARSLEDLYQKTLTDKIPWAVAAGALVITIIAGLITLS
jgi:hypothetical protein